jgi:alpha-beta hydrolase superfamily lysophospholipase
MQKRMRPPLLSLGLRIAKRVGALFGIVAVTLFGVRAYDSQRGPPLERWHTYVPHELGKAALDRSDWTAYLETEERIFTGVRKEVIGKMSPDESDSLNRYQDGSRVSPAHFNRDWNRSYVLEPAGPPQGAAVLLHGLTDSPFSLRHIAELYAAHGFVTLAIRLPGHGTVPAGLTEVGWEDWLAATRLAVREARRRIGPTAPIHLVGYSNGGALALMYALSAMDDPSLARPRKIILISPMVGVTRFARFAGLAAIPAMLPAFAKAAWLNIIPEFNPFKYNSFPVNAARQTYLLTQVLQESIQTHASAGRLADFPPVITFLSVIDFTVSARSVVTALHVHLVQGRSELVLFDINRNAKLGPLLSESADQALARLLPAAPRSFRTTVIANRNADEAEVEERMMDAGETEERVRPLGLSYPRSVYSLSHVALPFPVGDGLYGLEPSQEPAEDFGIRLGTVMGRGERGALSVSLDTMTRMSSNPFFPYLAQRLEEGLPPLRAGASQPD